MRIENCLNHTLRHDWGEDEVLTLLDLPFNDLIYQAQTVHRENFCANEVQMSTLLSIKTGGCPEDCAYCPQSAHHEGAVDATKMLRVESVLIEARRAKAAGATRYCMGAAWREPKERDLDSVCQMVQGVRDLGMESCVTLGMLTLAQAKRLAKAGLDYYNHNLDTSESFYGEIISTRSYQERLDTLSYVRDAGINVCCGGIVGMGEGRTERAELLRTLANMPVHPESVPINNLVQVEGTPLYGTDQLDAFEFVRAIATARILMPRSIVRLSAGRENMSDEIQALCFLAGANSIFLGDKLLTTANPLPDSDAALFTKLGVVAMPA